VPVRGLVPNDVRPSNVESYLGVFLFHDCSDFTNNFSPISTDHMPALDVSKCLDASIPQRRRES
jgi:hypothetical protein